MDGYLADALTSNNCIPTHSLIASAVAAGAVLGLVVAPCSLHSSGAVSGMSSRMTTCILWLVQVAAGAVLGVVVGYLVGVSWAHPLP